MNAFVCYRELNRDSNLKFLDFKIRVSDGLIQLGKKKTRGRPPMNPPMNPPIVDKNLNKKRRYTATEEVRFTNLGTHWPIKTFNDKTNEVQRGYCQYCSVKHRKVSTSTFKCSSCQTFLCLDSKNNCFYDYHHDYQSL